MAVETNKDPFFVIDDSGSLQNLLVVKRTTPDGERILPYSLAELVSSSVTVNNFGDLTSSINDISKSLASISSSASVSGSLEQIYNRLTASYNIQSSSYNQLTASNSYLSSVSASLSSSKVFLGDISSSNALVYSKISSSYDTLSSSNDHLSASSLTLTEINTGINNLTSSADTTYKYLTSSINTITASLSQSNVYVRQLTAYNRATHVRSTVIGIGEVSATNGLDLIRKDALVPGGATFIDEYQPVCIDVLIQNSTNKNCYIKIDWQPNGVSSPSDYTIKIPPGVIYNSEARTGNMRHIVYVTGSATGEVSAMMTYNTTLLTDPNYPPLYGPDNTIYNLTTNLYDFYNEKRVVNEWNFQSQDLYNKFTIVGQARVNTVGQFFDIYVTPSGSQEKTGSVTINSTTPQDFTIEILSPSNGYYELICDSQNNGLGDKGDGRILFADVLIQSASLPP